MKFLQLNITSFNTSCDDLWYHQIENLNDEIWLQQTNHNNSITLGNLKTWKCTQCSKIKLCDML